MSLYWLTRELINCRLYVLTLSIVVNSAIAFGQSSSPVDSGIKQKTTQEQSKSDLFAADLPTTNSDQKAADVPASTNKDQDQQKDKREKRGSFVIAPIPISSPAFGSGLLLITAYVFKLNEQDKVSPPSWVGASGAFTNNGSRALALGGRLYLKENKYQTTLAVIKGRANLDFFGIGRIPGRSPISVPLSMDGSIFFGEFLRNLGRNVFIGPRYQFRQLSASIDGIVPPGGFEVPNIDRKSNSAALGFHVQRDRRDSTFYPRKGTLIDFTADFFDQVFGSRREYQTYKVAYNGFNELTSRQIFAYRAMACSANGSVPFYDLCLFGLNNDLRGYTTGEFQNRRMFAAQTEYRLELRKRFGLAAFAGVGGVARRWTEFRSDQLLPAAGVGLRFKLDKKNHINYRIDFAVGREGRTISIGVGEAF
jgi:Omp85 superfamily domain